MTSLLNKRFGKPVTSLSPLKSHQKKFQDIRESEMTSNEVENLKKLSKVILISNVHKHRIKTLEETMGKSAFLKHFKFTEEEYEVFLNPRQELEKMDERVIEKNVIQDIFNFTGKKPRRTRIFKEDEEIEYKRTGSIKRDLFGINESRRRVEERYSTTASKNRNRSSGLRIGNHVFSSKKETSSISRRVTPTEFGGKDHTKTPDYKEKQTLTNNYGRYRTPKKELVTTKFSDSDIKIPQLRVDYSKNLLQERHDVNNSSQRQYMSNNTITNRIQKNSVKSFFDDPNKIKKPFIPYGGNLTERGKDFNWAHFRREKTSVYNNLDVKNMADYEYSYEPYNSPTRDTFLRNRYNGGKGGKTEEVKLEDHNSCTMYYALPKAFYQLEDGEERRVPNSRVYSPDYKPSHLARAIERFSVDRRDSSLENGFRFPGKRFAGSRFSKLFFSLFLR